MQVSVRSYLTAGVAVIGAGAIALTPVQPITAPTALPPVATQAMAVNLAAAIDPISPIVSTIGASLTNTGLLVSSWATNLFPIAQQVVANWGYYLTEFPNINTIISQIVGNIPQALQAPFSPGSLSPQGLANGDNISDFPVTVVDTQLDPPYDSLPFSQKVVWNNLPQVAPSFVAANTALLNFLNTPISGVLLGLAGPLIGPLVTLSNSITGAIAALQARNWSAAINTLINIPTAMINTFLNGGATLDLTSVFGTSLPASVNSIGFNLGGLLTTFTSTIPDGNTPVGSVQVGGVGFDSLAINATFANPFDPDKPDVTLDDPGLPVGFVGSLLSLSRYVAGAINNLPTASPGATKAASRRAPAARSAAAAAKPRAAAARHAK